MLGRTLPEEGHSAPRRGTARAVVDSEARLREEGLGLEPAVVDAIEMGGIGRRLTNRVEAPNSAWDAIAAEWPDRRQRHGEPSRPTRVTVRRTLR